MKISNKLIFLFFAAGALYTIVAAWLLLSGPRMETQASLRTFESEVPPPPEDAVPFYGEEEEPVLHPEDLPGPTEENLHRGKVYYVYYCIFCHGENGRGNGPVGQSYVPKPADLNADSITGYSISELYHASLTGTGHEPVLGQVIPAEHRKYLMLYIRQTFGK